MRKRAMTRFVILGAAATVILAAWSTANTTATTSGADPESTGLQAREVSTANAADRDHERPVEARDAERASRAALDEVGEGEVLDVDRDLEGGATWEVEILLDNGTVVDVLLDDRFRVLNVGDEREAGERPDDSHEDRDDDRDDD